MPNELKQIEEIAAVLLKASRQDSKDRDINKGYTAFDSDTVMQYGCDRLNGATALYKEGYRKASEVVREIFEEIEKLLKSQEAVTENQRLKEVADWIFQDYLPRRVAELKKKYESEGAE